MAMNPSASADERTGTGRADFFHNPWFQLIVGILAMVMVANMQYGWTAFVPPMHHHTAWPRASIQVWFTLFVLAETWLFPFETYLADRFGPQPLIAAGAVLTGLSWVINGLTGSLALLYFSGILGGIGTGLVYGTCISNAVKWFGTRRGLAAGLTAAGYGMGAAFTIIPIKNVIDGSGYQTAFILFGIVQGAIALVLAFFIRRAPKLPTSQARLSPRVIQGRRDATPVQILKTPVFWVMYAMFIAVATGGLMVQSNLASMATDFGIANVPVTIIGTLPAITYALSLSDTMNGLTRVISGALSDRFGREPLMFVVFMIEAIGIFLMTIWGANALAFVFLAGTVYFGYGEIFSLFPSTVRDHWGHKYAGTNYGLLYTAKGTSSLLIPVAAAVTAATGNWNVVLLTAAALNVIAAVMAVFVLRPMRVRDISRTAEPATLEPAGSIGSVAGASGA